MQFELYGGANSFINSVNVDSTAFATRSALFTVQLYASSSNFAPPYPEDGFTFLDGMISLQSAAPRSLLFFQVPPMPSPKPWAMVGIMEPM